MSPANWYRIVDHSTSKCLAPPGGVAQEEPALRSTKNCNRGEREARTDAHTPGPTSHPPAWDGDDVRWGGFRSDFRLHACLPAK